jgi:zinc transport system ATP-binding protein
VSVSEFVSSPHRIKKIPEGKCGYTNLTDCLSHVGLLEYKNRPIDELSGGQQQRALIARALMTDPSVLLLDEPTTGIDIQMQNQFYELIEHFNTVHGLSTIMITHDTARQYTF